MPNATHFPYSANTPGQHAAALLGRAAPTSATILLVGERGVGKTHLAKWVHAHSAVAQHPFVAVNCPSIPADLLEAEVFGTGTGQTGKISAADGGTLFLDEIGSLPAGAQNRLLGLLKQGACEPNGDEGTHRSNVRIIATTNQKLHRLVQLGQFDKELYDHLAGMSIEVPPLRKRREEIPAIARHMLSEICASRGLGKISLNADALEFLIDSKWPDNLREMRKTIERAAVANKSGAIGGRDLMQSIKPAENRQIGDEERVAAGDLITIEELETKHIRRILAQSKSLTSAAKTLGIDTSTLFRKRRRLGL
ncbi:MAG: NtrC-family two-component system response regulator AlgB [Pseudoalteromonas tetraodonis]|jgi:NtrC-family two-component system response regulator AlgB